MHLNDCEYLSKTGSQLIETIHAQKILFDQEKKSLETVVDLLSLNQIGVSGMNIFSSSTCLHSIHHRFNLKTFSNR